MMECTHEFFFKGNATAEDKCFVATCFSDDGQCCNELYSFVNFYQISWCWLGGMWYIMLIIGIFLIFLIFRFISNLVEEYLAPAVAYIAEFLKMSEAMGAVTLLALANGAGDVVTALVASGSADGVSYNIGALFGAGLFVCAIIVALTILMSPVKIQLTAASIWRDVGLYIVAGFLVVAFAATGYLHWWSSVLMLLLYCVLVLVVYLQERFAGPPTENEEKLLEEIEKDENKTNPDEEKAEEKPTPSMRFKGLVSKAVINKKTEDGKRLTFYDIVQHKLFEEKYKIRRTNRIIHTEKKDFFYFIDLVFEVLKRVTMPTCEAESFGRIQSIFFPILGCFFMTFFLFYSPATQTYWSWYWLISIPVGALFSLFFYFMIPKFSDGLPKIYILLQVIATVFSLIWTYFVSGILIDLLTFIGVISDFPTTYMGLTVIAVGNALPDGVTTIALAKRKLAVMGMTGAYAGQLFGLLVGFGLAMLKKTISEGPVPFDLFNLEKLRDNIMDIMVVFVSLTVLIITFIVGVLHKYELPKVLAYILFAIYIVFIVIATGIALFEMFD